MSKRYFSDEIRMIFVFKKKWGNSNRIMSLNPKRRHLTADILFPVTDNQVSDLICSVLCDTALGLYVIQHVCRSNLSTYVYAYASNITFRICLPLKERVNDVHITAENAIKQNELYTIVQCISFDKIQLRLRKLYSNDSLGNHVNVINK